MGFGFFFCFLFFFVFQREEMGTNAIELRRDGDKCHLKSVEMVTLLKSSPGQNSAPDRGLVETPVKHAYEKRRGGETIIRD